MMPKYSKKRRQMIQLTANRKKVKKIKKVTNFLQDINEEDFNIILNFLFNFNNENPSTKSNEEKLIKLQNLNNNEKENAIKLLKNMRYPREKNKGKIISPYLQKQLIELISNTLYQPQLSYTALQDQCNQLQSHNKKLIQKNEALI